MLSALKQAGKSSQIQKYALRVLKMALRQAVMWQLIPRNVADAIKPPSVVRREMTVWTAAQATAYIEASSNHRLHAAFYLALVTGMRRGELLGLHWDDIDWEQHTLAVRHNLVDVRTESEGRIYRGKRTVSRNVVSLQTPKTDKSRRTIPLSEGALRRLREHRVKQDVERTNAAEVWHGTTHSGYVFATEIGTGTNPRNLSRLHAEFAAQAGVPYIRFHDLRHTAASLMIERGVPAKVVSEILGHADVAFTLQIYTHLYEKQKRAAVFDLDDFLPVESATFAAHLN